MQFPNITAIDLLVVFVSVYAALAFQDNKRRRGLPYPPGPRSWPIIGNLLDVPSRNPWAAYAEMSKTYGAVHIYPQLSGTKSRGCQAMSCRFAFLARS